MIASIEDQQIINKILAHLMQKGALPPPPVAAGNAGLTRFRLVCIARSTKIPPLPLRYIAAAEGQVVLSSLLPDGGWKA